MQREEVQLWGGWLQLPLGCSTLGRTRVQEKRTKHRAPGAAGGGLWDLMGEMTSRRKQWDQFGRTDGGQGSQKLEREEETREFQEEEGRGSPRCCQSPPRCPDPKLDEQAAKSPEEKWERKEIQTWWGSGVGGFHCPRLNIAGYAWHRHSLSRILIRQSLKLGRTKNRGTQQGLSQAQEKALAVLLEGLCVSRGEGRNGFGHLSFCTEQDEKVCTSPTGMSSETGRQKLLVPINTYFQAWGPRWARVSVGTWGTLKNTTNTKQSQKAFVGICISPGSGRKSQAVLWPDLTAQHQQPAPQQEDSFGGTLVSAFGAVKLGCRFPPTFTEGGFRLKPQALSGGVSVTTRCVVGCRDNKMIWVHQIFHSQEQKLPWGQGSQSCETGSQSCARSPSRKRWR